MCHAQSWYTSNVFRRSSLIALDDISYDDGRPPLTDVVGGAGTYATMGARLFYDCRDRANVGFVVHAGSDFPESIREEIAAWQSGTIFQETPERRTTRGKNTYHGEIRGS